MVLAVSMSLVGFLAWKIRHNHRSRIHHIRHAISRDLHDEIGSNISKIALLSEVMKQNPVKEHNITNMEKITSAAHEALKNMGEIVWYMNPKNDMLESLVAYTRKYAAEYFEYTSIECKVNIPSTIRKVPISGDKRRNVFLAVKEALHNVVKHSDATMVSLTIINIDHSVEIKIQDNGKGFEHGDNNFGNGLHNMRSRMNQIGGNFAIENKVGATVKLSFPL